MANLNQTFELDTIVCGDCLDVMRDMPDGCVDAVVTDPPYGTSTKQWDKEPSNLVWEELKRICPNGPIAIFGYAKQLFRWSKYFDDLNLIGFIAWHHYSKVLVSSGLSRAHQDIAIWGQSLKQVRADNVREPYSGGDHLIKWFNTEYSTGELAKRLTRERRHPNGRRCTDLWHIANPGDGFNAKLKNHPNEKPLDALNRLVRLLSFSNQVVFDPFIGSGTTAVAALKLGRHFYGCDISPEYVKLANERIEKTRLELSQLELAL